MKISIIFCYFITDINTYVFYLSDEKKNMYYVGIKLDSSVTFISDVKTDMYHEINFQHGFGNNKFMGNFRILDLKRLNFKLIPPNVKVKIWGFRLMFNDFSLSNNLTITDFRKFKALKLVINSFDENIKNRATEVLFHDFKKLVLIQHNPIQ